MEEARLGGWEGGSKERWKRRGWGGWVSVCGFLCVNGGSRKWGRFLFENTCVCLISLSCCFRTPQVCWGDVVRYPSFVLGEILCGLQMNTAAFVLSMNEWALGFWVDNAVYSLFL